MFKIPVEKEGGGGILNRFQIRKVARLLIFSHFHMKSIVVIAVHFALKSVIFIVISSTAGVQNIGQQCPEILS